MCFFKCSGSEARIHPFSLGLAVGVVKGLWFLGVAWAGWLGGYGMDMIARMQQYNESYGPTFVGGLIGGAYGLICGFIMGFIIAWFYNRFLGYCKKPSDS